MADDLFDQLIKSAPWMVIPATLLTAAPKILEFWHGLNGVRDGRKHLEIERARLENLKLRIEIEALKKQHGLNFESEDVPSGNVVPGLGRTKQPDAAVRKPVEKKLWGWLSRLATKWPGMTRTAVSWFSLGFIWLGMFTVLTFIAVGIATWITERQNPKTLAEEFGYYLLGGFLLLLLPGVLVLKLGFSLKTQRRQLQGGVKPPAMTPPVAVS